MVTWRRGTGMGKEGRGDVEVMHTYLEVPVADGRTCPDPDRAFKLTLVPE